ncbi:MAG: phage N-6-adenine-methyltransferase [Thermodesulfobacteriota bacterium]
MVSEILFSKKSDEYETPKWLFKQLDDKFHFNLDPAATSENHLCDKYFTKEDNGLSKDWSRYTVFLNPPYSNAGDWIKKAYESAKEIGTTVVCLIPARTDTKYFHKYCIHADYIFFIEGRLKFENRSDGDFKQNCAPFPSIIVIFDPHGRYKIIMDKKLPVVYSLKKGGCLL